MVCVTVVAAVIAGRQVLTNVSSNPAWQPSGANYLRTLGESPSSADDAEMRKHRTDFYNIVSAAEVQSIVCGRYTKGLRSCSCTSRN